MAETLEKVAEEINGKVAAVKTDLQNSIDELKTEKDQVEQKYDGLKNENEKLKDDVAELKGEITALRESATEKESRKKGQLISYLNNTERKENVSRGFGKKNRFENSLSVKMTTADVLPVAGGIFQQLFGNFIDPEIYETPKRPEFMMDLVTVTTNPGTERIWFTERVNEVGNAQYINEGDPKPDISAQWQQNDAPIVEIAESWVMTERLMNHAPSVVSNFREHANDLIRLGMDAGLYDGTGVAPDVSGITVLASPFVVPPQLAAFYPQANIWDVIHAVAVSITLANYVGEMTVVLNPVWMAVMKGIKNSEGDYIVPPFVTPEGDTVSGMRIVFNTYVGDDEILLGILPNFKVRIAEDITFGEGFINDDFTRNQVRFKLSAFFGTYLPSSLQGSIVFDNISTILALISAP